MRLYLGTVLGLSNVSSACTNGAGKSGIELPSDIKRPRYSCDFVVVQVKPIFNCAVFLILASWEIKRGSPLLQSFSLFALTSPYIAW